MALSPGEEAPDFDLSSTENALLALRDEAPRLAVLLYVFRGEAGEGVRADLAALARARPGLTRLGARPLVLSPLPLAALAALQAELRLDFPLLHDDRDFAAAYGVAAAEDGEPPPAPALFLIGHDRRLLWLANPAGSVEGGLDEVRRRLAALAPASRSYPRAVLSRFVGRRVARNR
ncbi:MAG: redoxin domain-containing protein [Thermoanaerobaculia bacterium]|nr:redoxin domain-containing protein [Thermoanaerobaculia bacterium]MCZ7652817.1 redoxin domain-containing protein [Thermoanaerobaculia bacterium]